jgi:PmbA protein
VAALEQENLLKTSEEALKFAQQMGADDAEVFVYQGLTTKVNIERGQIAKNLQISDLGLGIRATIKKAMGFAYTNVLESKTTIQETVTNALSLAKASKPDTHWSGFPTKYDFPTVKDTYDKKIVQLDSEDMVTHTSAMLKAAEGFDDRIFPIEGEVASSYLTRTIVNSNGVEGHDYGTIIECSIATIAKGNHETTPICFEFDIKRKYEIDPERVGREAARLAISALKSEKVETGKTNVIFTQFALQQLLHFTLINAVKADFVQRGQSALKNKLGLQVAADALTIIDDGLLDGGIRTWRFDGEGIPQQRTPIIEKGILQNYIYDHYTAKKDGKESTGNASRAGYRSTPNVDATNFHIIPGNKTTNELIRESENGLLVYYLQGAHSSNPASGEYSVVATPAWKIENGSISKATRGTMLAGSIFQVLKNVSALGCNERKLGQIVTPWILVENVKVIGN